MRLFNAWIVKMLSRWISGDDVTWIVNNLGELGVKIGSRSFFMCKGQSLEYPPDDGPMTYRPVYKREFGEVIKTDVEGGEFFPLFTERDSK